MQSETTQNTDEASVDAEALNLEALLDVESSQPAKSADNDEQTPDGNSEAAGDGAKNATLEKFNDLAEATGVELDKLYALTVTTNDGESVSIQDLKALHQQQGAIAVRELEIEEQASQRAAELQRAQNELNEIIASLPAGSINEQTLKTVRERQASRVESEQRKTLEAIPAWRDEEQREKELIGMAKYLEGYGLPATFLQQVIDHRQVRFIRDAYLREQRIQKALSKVRAGKPNPTTPPATTSAPPKKTAAVSRQHRSGDALAAFFKDVE